MAAGAICLLAGCETTGMSMREQAGVSYPNYVMSLPTNSLPNRAMALPMRLAVVQVGETAPPGALLNKLAAQKSLVASVVALPLPGDTERSSYHIYDPKNTVPAEDYAARMAMVRGLAQKVGADHVFLFGGNIDSRQKHNFLSVLDLTIVGGVLVPGGRVDVEGKSGGVLIDAETGAPEFFVSAETRGSKLAPDWLADEREVDLRVCARDDLVGQLGDRLLEKLSASANTNR